MTRKSIGVIGIMIGAELKNIKLYHMEGSWEENTQGSTYTGTESAGDGWAEGLRDVLGYITTQPSPTTQFVLVYDVSNSNREEDLKKLLTGINKVKKNDSLPSLISIGHEQSPLSEIITRQVSICKEVESTEDHDNLLKTIIEREYLKTKNEILAAELLNTYAIESSHPTQTNNSSINNISMMVLGGFIAAAGVAAVAIAFTLLNVATFGVAGLVVAAVGVAAALSGAGLFATSVNKNREIAPDESLNCSGTLAHQ